MSAPPGVAKIVASAVLLLAACASAPPPDSRAIEADAALNALAATGFVGSARVACGDTILFEGDYGLTLPPGRQPSYWIASISKQVTAAAILRLEEQGRLNASDTLSRFFPDAPADKAGITLTQLMTHQSGLPQTYAADGVTDRAEAARAIFAVPLQSEPGAQFRYANDNYNLLAIIVEQVSGRSFEAYVAAELFAPAGMTASGFWPNADDDIVPPILAPVEPPADVANWGFRGATGMRASVADLHLWVRALETGRVITADNAARMWTTNVTVREGVRTGFGWFRETLADGREALWTSGYEQFGGNAVIYRVLGTGLIVIAATNAGPDEASGPGWSRRARDALLTIYSGSTPCAS